MKEKMSEVFGIVQKEREFESRQSKERLLASMQKSVRSSRYERIR